MEVPATQPNSPGVSIIVCCYNSAKRLPETLRHLAAQQASADLDMEVIIIDNVCTDNTAQTALDIWSSLDTPCELRVVTEPVPGLTHARIRGIKESMHEILIFCDDDNWLDPAYARFAFELMESDPHIALAGGINEAVFETDEVPIWFKELAGAYAVGGGDGACEISEGGIVWGAGMVARTNAMERLIESDFEFLTLDRKGSALSCGGDGELCQAMQWLGHKVFHDGRLKLKHWIPEERLNWNYVVRLSKGWGAATVAGDPVRLVQHRHQPVRNFIRKSFVYQIIRSVVSLVPLLKKLKGIENREGDLAALSATSKIGRLQAIIKLNFRYRATIAAKAHWLEQNAANLSVKSE